MTGADWRWVKMISVEGIEYDYTNMYRIYIDGRIEGVKRKGCRKNIFLKEFTDKKGYKHIQLRKDNKKKSYLIHRLVAIHFIPNPHKFLEVDHKNQEKDDNSIDNLRWCSRATNMRNLTRKRPKNDLPRGVRLTPSGKYQAIIRINGKDKYLGQYEAKEEASRIYKEALSEQMHNELNPNRHL